MKNFVIVPNFDAVPRILKHLILTSYELEIILVCKPNFSWFPKSKLDLLCTCQIWITIIKASSPRYNYLPSFKKNQTKNMFEMIVD